MLKMIMYIAQLAEHAGYLYHQEYSVWICEGWERGDLIKEIFKHQQSAIKWSLRYQREGMSFSGKGNLDFV